MSEVFSQLGIHWKLLLAQAVNFVLVVWLLNRFVFKRLIAFIDARREHIEEGVELREKAERELERINEARRRELENAKRQGEELILQAKTLATEKEREMLAQAKARAEEALLQAKKDAERLRHEVLKQSEKELKKTALVIAEKILSRSLTKEDEERMAREVLKALDT